MAAVTSKNIMTEDLGEGNFRQTEMTGMPAVDARQSCTDATRPAASTFLPGTGIWNSSAAQWQYSDGTNWYTAGGVLV
jgi:hypothetical protein